MQNWTQIVRERLQGQLRVPDPGVISELATHLEEVYEEARSLGLTEQQALQTALQELEDCRALTTEIHRAKSEEGRMNHRTRTLWLPAAVNLIAASGVLAFMQFVGVRPRFIWLDLPGQPFAMMFYVPWLALLPLLGGLGAYLARRAHADLSARLMAGLAPALAFLCLMCLALPVDLIVGTAFSRWKVIAIASWLLTWGILPGLSLLLGALPFVKDWSSRREAA